MSAVVKPKILRPIVCGSRYYSDSKRLWFVLSDLDAKRGPFEVVIHGAARGADSLAMRWAQENGKKQLPFQADWKNVKRIGAVVKYGDHGSYDALAGHVRNQRMIDEGKPDACIAFAGHTGTWDMVNRAREARLEVVLIDWPGQKRYGT